MYMVENEKKSGQAQNFSACRGKFRKKAVRWFKQWIRALTYLRADMRIGSWGPPLVSTIQKLKFIKHILTLRRKTPRFDKKNYSNIYLRLKFSKSLSKSKIPCRIFFLNFIFIFEFHMSFSDTVGKLDKWEIFFGLLKIVETYH